MSVTIVDFKQRENSIGETFHTLLLEGEIEMVKSQETGKYYATAKRASITSTFNRQRCEQLIGTQMPGSIQKVECDPYEYTLPETGEVITLSHTYVYQPEGQLEPEPVTKDRSLEEAVFAHSNGSGNAMRD
jgi:uncharacterized OB-fold protein